MYGHEPVSHHYPCNGEGLSFHHTSEGNHTQWENHMGSEIFNISQVSMEVEGKGFIGLHYSLDFSQAWCLDCVRSTSSSQGRRIWLLALLVESKNKQ